VGGEQRETRKDKILFEIGRGLLLGGLAATIFRHELHFVYPAGAVLVGMVLLILYARKEDHK